MARGKNITEITILNLLCIRPMYGVEMIEEIKRLSGNAVVMVLPTLYSCLHRMAAKKFVNSYQQESAIGGRRRVYNITKSGREYLARNPIEIDYSIIADHSAKTHKTFATLEEAFSLPLNNKPLPELPEDKRILQLTPPPEPVKSTLKTMPKISPYIDPSEKITTTPEPQYQQTSFGMSGTLGGNDLRPLVKLNTVTVGSDYVMINRLRMVAAVLKTVIFMIINFLCSLTHTVQNEYYNLIYIILLLYAAIQLAVYLIYPRIKAVLNRKSCGIRRAIVSSILLALAVTYCVIKSASMLWLVIFTLLPLVEFVFIINLSKRKWFLC